jgi:hypothetical protein
MHSGDIDRSGAITAADVLELVDLLTGVQAYEVWDGTTNPIDNAACP